MKLTVNPLVVAAALGLLGPAALTEDADPEIESIAGIWKRSGHAHPASALHMGDEIQVVPFEDKVMLDDGIGGPQGTWTMGDDGPARQQLCVDGTKVVRTFAADGDRLDVHVTVQSSDGLQEFRETFVRTA